MNYKDALVVELMEEYANVVMLGSPLWVREQILAEARRRDEQSQMTFDEIMANAVERRENVLAPMDGTTTDCEGQMQFEFRKTAPDIPSDEWIEGYDAGFNAGSKNKVIDENNSRT